uniref:Synaptopodin 2 n=1 Tax=Cyprinus carpio TaxID=7962 RepID=A0A8C2Q3Q5_CYPCA
MGTGEFACVTLRGGAPWGFRLSQSAQDPQQPIQVLEIEDGSPAAVAGLCENDELVSVNGKPCSNLSLSDAIDLIEASADCLQLLVKRYFIAWTNSFEMVSTTFQIPSPSRPHGPQELYTSEYQDEAYYGETDSDGECPVGTRLVRTQVKIPASWNKSTGINVQGGGDTHLDVTPGSVVELQLSLSKTTLEEPDCTALGSACGFVGDIYHRTTDESVNYTTTAFSSGKPLYIPRQDRQPLGQRGVLVSKPPALPGQVEVTVQESSRSSSEKEGLEASQRLDSGGEEGGYIEEAPTSLSVSFGLPSEECDSESEREVNEPNKHRARHARLRRSESLSEKQVKEAKSKCKRIALLLSAPAPNPNKGVLMFKKHRQRAKKYTLVSYGTGEDEPNYKDDEDEKEEHAVEFTVLATSETETDEDFFTNASGQKSIVSFDWDTGLLEIERKLDSQQGMDALPETKGKGVLMFAQRKQRMDEIVEEHEEMRRKGIPVEAVQEPETHQTYQHMEEQTYMHAQENQSYMDVNLHHTTATAAAVSRIPEAATIPAPATTVPTTARLPATKNVPTHAIIQSATTLVAAPFSSSSSADNQEQPGYSLGQGEQIASRDERISVPAIKTGILQDTRRRSANKPMFTFKESPKVSPNPALLNLLNRNDKKAGLEFCSEEDYLSLGAEACNFLQSSKTKHKIPPPVAPKPHINPASPPWSIQQETTDQPIPQQTENSVPSSVSSIAQNESQKLPPQPIKPWSPTQTSQPTPPRRMNSYTTGTKAPSPVPTRSTMSPSGFGSAFEMPALKGKGAELFAKRQSRMEKYIVDSTTVQSNKARPSSPCPSLPHSWKYSPNCRAPPPLAYNPIHSPSYPPGAIKQPPPSSPSTANKNKNKDKQKPAPKPLHVLDVMKHQPYQLNSSLFTYGPAAEKLAPSVNPYQQAPSPPYQQPSPPSYQTGPNPVYLAGPALSYQPAPSSYVVPSYPVAARADSASGGSIIAAPKPKFSAKKSAAQVSVSSSPSPRPASQITSVRLPVGQTVRLDRGHKPPTPWEAASRHPLGLVDEAFTLMDIQQSIASNLRYAAQSKLLPEPPAEWKAKVAYEPPPKNQKDSLSQSSLAFLSPTKSTASAPAGPVPYRSPFRQCQPQRSMTEANLRPSQGGPKEMGPHRLRFNKAKDSSPWRL